MTILSSQALTVQRGILKRRLHNDIYSIRKWIAGTTIDENPLFTADNADDWIEYDGFKALAVEVLSGKMNRLFEERNLDILKDLGSVNKVVYVINYVPNQELATGELISLEENDQIELFTNDWWKILQIVPDSQGLQQQAIATK